MQSVYLGHDDTSTSNAMYPQGVAILQSVYIGYDGSRTSNVCNYNIVYDCFDKTNFYNINFIRIYS